MIHSFIHFSHSGITLFHLSKLQLRVNNVRVEAMHLTRTRAVRMLFRVILLLQCLFKAIYESRWM